MTYKNADKCVVKTSSIHFCLFYKQKEKEIHYLPLYILLNTYLYVYVFFTSLSQVTLGESPWCSG